MWSRFACCLQAAGENFSLQIWVGGVGEAKREGMNREGEALVPYATWEV